jgi:hypothetical protein
MKSSSDLKAHSTKHAGSASDIGVANNFSEFVTVEPAINPSSLFKAIGRLESKQSI